MRASVLFLVGLGVVAASDVLPTIKVTHQGRTFGSDPIPTLDQGHLFYLSGSGTVAAWGPTGQHVFETSVLGPLGGPAGATSVAMDSQGTIAVAIAFSSSAGAEGGIAFLDRTGRQVKAIPTGRYMPMHLCFDENHRLWAFGWQRDADNNVMEEDEPYMVVRRFSTEGTELGRFLPRSLFPGKLSPFSGQRGLWRVRAARDRIGGLAHPNSYQHQREWVELDLDGNLIGRWPVDFDVHGGYAFTSSGQVFVREGRVGRIFLLDRSLRKWAQVGSASQRSGDLSRSLLLGAVADELVFAVDGGSRLIHVNADAFPREDGDREAN